MTEDVNKLLNISEENSSNIDSNDIDISEEKYLRTIAYIILVAGILSTLILLFSITFTTVKTGEYQLDEKTVFNITGLVITLATLISTLGLHAFFIVISNISISLKRMNGNK